MPRGKIPQSVSRQRAGDEVENRVVVKFVTTLNGISIAYVMGVVNAGLGLLLAFGVNLNDQQQSYIVTFVNACLILLAHVSHRNGEVHPTPSSYVGSTPTVSPVTDAPTTSA